MQPSTQVISPEICLSILRQIPDLPTGHFYDPQKHRIHFSNQKGEEIAIFRLPIQLQASGDEIQHFSIALVQSGAAAVGCFDAEQCLDHKVFKSYMVRKKQGKSQLKYLKTKGKSKAGSRVRLGNAYQFFEDINERLTVYEKNFLPERLALSCSKTLTPYLYQSSVPFPMTKGHERLMKISKHIHTPGLEVLFQSYRHLLQGEIIWKTPQRDLLLDILPLGEAP
jgi:hypothetical protein